MAEDKTGFIWIGTSNGLNRYDGYRIKQYFHNDNDSNSLNNNSIHSIQCDTLGRIWITTDIGVNCFFPDKNLFISYSAKSIQSRKLHKASSTVFLEKDGSVWIVNQQKSIFRVANDMSLVEININTPVFQYQNQKLNGYGRIFQDKKGNEWGYIANRIYLLNPKSKQPTRLYDFTKIIQDNGIGRKKAAEYNSMNRPNHKSVGLKITEDRINIFNKQANSNGNIKFIDLFDNYNIPDGTRVEITVKIS